MNPGAKINEHLHARDYEAARKLAEQYIERDPNSADGFYLLGVVAHFQGRIHEAVEQLQKALKINPKHVDAGICLSIIFNDIGAYEKAKRVFEDTNQSVSQSNSPSTLDVDKKFAVKHLELADLYFRYRRYDEALDEYNKAALLDPTDLKIPIRRAKTMAKKGFITRAIQELQRIRDENPGFSEARLQLGLIYQDQGNLLDAEIEWEAAMERDPNNSEIRQNLEVARKKRNTSY